MSRVRPPTAHGTETGPLTALVTGAAGFVGQALVRRLRADDVRVRALVRPGDPRRAELDGDVEVVEADVTDPAGLAPHVAGVDTVFHAAALVHGWHPWARYRAVNVDGTRHVALAARAAGVRRLVHVSTSDVFGIPPDGVVLDEARPFAPWGEPYPDTKIEGERWLWRFHRESGLPVSVVYPGWVYGPGDAALFPGLARAIRDGLLVFWQRDTRLNWVHVRNLADALVLVARAPAAAGEGYLVDDGADGPTLEAVSARLAALVERPFAARYVPYALAWAGAAAAQAVWRVCGLRGEPPLLTADVKAFGHRFRFSTAKVRALGWTPRVGIAEGMDEAFAAFAARARGQGPARTRDCR